MLKPTFISLVQRYTEDSALADKLWSEIEKTYSGWGRHYHNLSHLENIFSQLNEVREEIEDWDTMLFSLYYHDIVYRATSKENEEESAAKALDALRKIAYSSTQAKKCVDIILATKAHFITDDHDTNLFIDADLSILGAPWETYADYCKKVRKEYFIYPGFMYKPGRKRVLEHFLKMKRIFKTDFFHNKYEERAKENLQKELELL